MAGALGNKTEKRETAEKRVSLTIVPPPPGSQDIRVEVKRNLSAAKRKRQKRFAAFFFAVMLLMLFPIIKDVAAYVKMSQELQSVQQRNQELTGLKQQLQEEMDLLNTPEMVEKLAREDLNMVKPGESKVYQAIPTDDIPQREELKQGEERLLH
jgi:cell division protein DivIC